MKRTDRMNGLMYSASDHMLISRYEKLSVFMEERKLQLLIFFLTYEDGIHQWLFGKGQQERPSGNVIVFRGKGAPEVQDGDAFFCRFQSSLDFNGKRIGIVHPWGFRHTWAEAAGTAEEWIDTTEEIRRIMEIHDSEELRCISNSAEMTESVWLELKKWLEPGKTEAEVVRYIRSLARKQGSGGIDSKSAMQIWLNSFGDADTDPDSIMPCSRRIQKSDAVFLHMNLCGDSGFYTSLTDMIIPDDDQVLRKQYESVCRLQREMVDDILDSTDRRQITDRIIKRAEESGRDGQFRKVLANIRRVGYTCENVNEKQKDLLRLGMTVAVEVIGENPEGYPVGYGRTYVIGDHGCILLTEERHLI